MQSLPNEDIYTCTSSIALFRASLSSWLLAVITRGATTWWPGHGDVRGAVRGRTNVAATDRPAGQLVTLVGSISRMATVGKS
jgi:hypothetical protein